MNSVEKTNLYEVNETIAMYAGLLASFLKDHGINGKVAVTVLDTDRKKIIVSQQARTPRD